MTTIPNQHTNTTLIASPHLQTYSIKPGDAKHDVQIQIVEVEKKQQPSSVAYPGQANPPQIVRELPGAHFKRPTHTVPYQRSMTPTPSVSNSSKSNQNILFNTIYAEGKGSLIPGQMQRTEFPPQKVAQNATPLRSTTPQKTGLPVTFDNHSFLNKGPTPHYSQPVANFSYQLPQEPKMPLKQSQLPISVTSGNTITLPPRITHTNTYHYTIPHIPSQPIQYIQHPHPQMMKHSAELQGQPSNPAMYANFG